jgi:hypothetical protein
VDWNKAHYADLKDDTYFSTCKCIYVSTAHMHHMHCVLDKTYVPISDVDIGLFKENQSFTYAVFKEHLKTNMDKSLLSQFDTTDDAQSFYLKLKRHALTSTAE